MSITLTPQQQAQLIDLLIPFAKALWEMFGKDLAMAFIDWVSEKLGGGELIAKIKTFITNALTPKDLNVARFMIFDDQCTPVKEGECVTPDGSIDADCNDTADSDEG